MPPIRIAIIGLGKIARDQHRPAIAANAGFALAATVSPIGPGLPGTPHFTTLEDLLAAGPALDAVALCTPPQARFKTAACALRHGLDVLLEKPPGATLAEVAALQALADQAGAVLFASWHSRFAAGVDQARAWLATRSIAEVSIVWREDVRVWHPGQDWIWQPGGLGVFDPGINALSIATHILPRPILVTRARLMLPGNRAAPIAAQLDLRDTAGTPITMDLDWRQTGPQRWDIHVQTDRGLCVLGDGGARLSLPGQTAAATDGEYAALYRHFATLMRERRSDVDIAPLRLVADAFLIAERRLVAPFED